MTNSWVAAELSGTTAVGSLVGRSTSAPRREVILRDSYWDNDSTGGSDAVGTIEEDDEADDEADGTSEIENVTGLATDEMQRSLAEQTMDAMDFEDTWTVQTDPDDYPLLQWQDESGDGDADDDGSGLAVGAGLAGIGGIAAVRYLLKLRADAIESNPR